MSDVQNELEDRVTRWRSRQDQTQSLDQKIYLQRRGGIVQQDRSSWQERHREAGVSSTFQTFESSMPLASSRGLELLGPQPVRLNDIKPAIGLSTGILGLDMGLGGGLPPGFTEIYGPESVGKSTLVYELIRSAQQQDRQAALLATEFFDSRRMQNAGIDMDELILIRGAGIQVLECCETLLLDNEKLVLFIDSATGLRPEIDEYDQWVKMLVWWFERVAGRMGQESCVVMVNQVRARRSIDPRRFFAGGTNSAAHRAASYFDTRLELTRENVSDDTYNLMINIVANYLSAPHRVVSLPVVKVQGIDCWRDTVRIATQMGILENRASHYCYQGEVLAHGEEPAARRLERDVDLGDRIFNETRALARASRA